MAGKDPNNLAVAVHQGADGAVDRLVMTYQDRLFSYALHLLLDPFDAREVTQDALVKACHALTTRYDAGKCSALQMEPWLFRITRNLAYNRRRARASRKEVSVADHGEVQAAGLNHDAEVIRQLESMEEHRTLRLALRRLHPEARDLILLRFLEEMSYAEIASIAGCGEAAVRGKVFRALRKLRAALTESGGKDELR